MITHSPAELTVDTNASANPAHVIVIDSNANDRSHDPSYLRAKRDAEQYREQQRYDAAIRRGHSIASAL